MVAFWGVTLAGVVFLAVAGVAMATVVPKPRFVTAQVCFVSGALAAASDAAVWEAVTPQPSSVRLTVGIFSAVALVLGLLGGLRWARQCERLHDEAPAPTGTGARAFRVVGRSERERLHAVSISRRGAAATGETGGAPLPQPRLELLPMAENERLAGLYRSLARLKVTTGAPVPELHLEARASTIVKMEAVAQWGGADMTGDSSTGDGVAFTTLLNASGDYVITLVSRAPEQFDITWDCA